MKWKKAEGVNWYLVGAFIFGALVVIIMFILRKQAGGQEGIVSAIFKLKP